MILRWLLRSALVNDFCLDFSGFDRLGRRFKLLFCLPDTIFVWCLFDLLSSICSWFWSIDIRGVNVLAATNIFSGSVSGITTACTLSTIIIDSRLTLRFRSSSSNLFSFIVIVIVFLCICGRWINAWDIFFRLFFLGLYSSIADVLFWLFFLLSRRLVPYFLSASISDLLSNFSSNFLSSRLMIVYFRFRFLIDDGSILSFLSFVLVRWPDFVLRFVISQNLAAGLNDSSLMLNMLLIVSCWRRLHYFGLLSNTLTRSPMD